MSPRPSLVHIRRPQILDVATRLLQRDGFHDVRMDEIAKEAGVSPAMVLHYFDSKTKDVRRSPANGGPCRPLVFPRARPHSFESEDP